MHCLVKSSKLYHFVIHNVDRAPQAGETLVPGWTGNRRTQNSCLSGPKPVNFLQKPLFTLLCIRKWVSLVAYHTIKQRHNNRGQYKVYSMPPKHILCRRGGVYRPREAAESDCRLTGELWPLRLLNCQSVTQQTREPDYSSGWEGLVWSHCLELAEFTLDTHQTNTYVTHSQMTALFICSAVNHKCTLNSFETVNEVCFSKTFQS